MRISCHPSAQMTDGSNFDKTPFGILMVSSMAYGAFVSRLRIPVGALVFLEGVFALGCIYLCFN